MLFGPVSYTHLDVYKRQRYCREQAALGTDIYVDPVMGDYGKLYGGASERDVYKRQPHM